MRRDTCYYFEADVASVYNACSTAAKMPPFERSCKEEPYHTFSFGLNYSFKYNMNGGSCTVRFMPYGNGTAVNMRFTIAQGFGARYERYAEDFMNAVMACSGLRSQPCRVDVEEFLKEENKAYIGFHQNVDSQPQNKFCTKCGAASPPEALFCSMCGTTLKKADSICSNCGTKTTEGAAFCHICGTKL